MIFPLGSILEHGEKKCGGGGGVEIHGKAQAVCFRLRKVERQVCLEQVCLDRNKSFVCYVLSMNYLDG